MGLRGPNAEACSSPAHTQTCQAQPQTCWQNKQRQTQGTRPSLSARGRPAPAPPLSPRGRAASEPQSPGTRATLSGRPPRSTHESALQSRPPLAPRRMLSRGSYRLRLQSHTEFFQNRWVVRSPRIIYQGSAIVRNFVSGAGDPRSDAEPGTKRPGPREASRTPSDSSSARGRQQSRSQKLCGPRSPPGPACAGPAIHAVLTGGAPGLPGPRSGTTAQACPTRPTRGGGEPEVPAAARPGRARDPAPSPGSGTGAPRPGCPATPRAAQVGGLRPGHSPRAPTPGPRPLAPAYLARRPPRPGQQRGSRAAAALRPPRRRSLSAPLAPPAARPTLRPGRTPRARPTPAAEPRARRPARLRPRSRRGAPAPPGCARRAPFLLLLVLLRSAQ